VETHGRTTPGHDEKGIGGQALPSKTALAVNQRPRFFVARREKPFAQKHGGVDPPVAPRRPLDVDAEITGRRNSARIASFFRFSLRLVKPEIGRTLCETRPSSQEDSEADEFCVDFRSVSLRRRIGEGIISGDCRTGNTQSVRVSIRPDRVVIFFGSATGRPRRNRLLLAARFERFPVIEHSIRRFPLSSASPGGRADRRIEKQGFRNRDTARWGRFYRGALPRAAKFPGFAAAK